VEGEFAGKPSVEELYKPLPQPQLAQYAQPYAQPPQPQPVHVEPQQSAPAPAQPPVVVQIMGVPRETLTKEDLKGVVEEAISKKAPAEAPPKPEVDFETRLRQAFEEERRKERGWGEVIAAAKESQEKIQGIFKAEYGGPTRAVETPPVAPPPQPTPAEPPKVQQVEKPPQVQPQEQVEKPSQLPQVKPPDPKAQAQPEASPQAIEARPEVSQPPEPPMSPSDVILMSRRLAREATTREVEKRLVAEEARKAEERKKVEEGEKEQKEEPQREALPEEVLREESTKESPQRRGIFPILRRRRLRLLG